MLAATSRFPCATSDAEWPLKFSCRYSNHSSRPRKLARAPALASHRSTDSQSSPGVAWQSSPRRASARRCISIYRDFRDRSPAEPALPGESSASVKGTERILVVEDESEVRAVSVAVLRDMGYQVLEAPDGPSALDILQKGSEHIDMLFTDVVLPSGMNGAVLAAQALAIRPEAPRAFHDGVRAQRSHACRPARLGGRVDCEALHVPGIRCARARGVRSAIHLVGSLGWRDAASLTLVLTLTGSTRAAVHFVAREAESYLRQNAPVNRTTSVKISIRPASIASVQVHVWKSVSPA